MVGQPSLPQLYNLINRQQNIEIHAKWERTQSSSRNSSQKRRRQKPFPRTRDQWKARKSQRRCPTQLPDWRDKAQRPSHSSNTRQRLNILRQIPTWSTIPFRMNLATAATALSASWKSRQRKDKESESQLSALSSRSSSGKDRSMPQKSAKCRPNKMATKTKKSYGKRRSLICSLASRTKSCQIWSGCSRSLNKRTLTSWWQSSTKFREILRQNQKEWSAIDAKSPTVMYLIVWD